MATQAPTPSLVIIIEGVEDSLKHMKDRNFMRNPISGTSLAHTLHMAACALQERSFELMEAEHAKGN